MSTPDFDSAKGYYWMRQTHAAIQAGVRDRLPTVPRTYNPNKFDRASKEAQKTNEWRAAVERRLSRRTFS